MEEVKQPERKPKHRWSLVLVILVVIACVAGIVVWKISDGGKEPSQQVVFVVGSKEVYLDEVHFCMLQNAMNLGLTRDSLENSTTKNGSSTADDYKNDILQVIMDYKVEALVAEEQGITLTEEEEKQARSEVIEYMSTVDGGVLYDLGITRDRLIEIFSERYLANKLEQTVKDDVEVEKANYCTIYLMMFPKIKMTEDGDYERQEDGVTPIMLSDEEIEKCKEDADAAYERLVAAEDVETVAKEYGVLTYSGEESNTPESFGEPFTEYAQSLKDGECSPVLETESCYAILKMITVNDEEIADQIMQHYRAEMEEEAVTEKKKEWYEQMGIGDEPEWKGNTWNQISLYDYVQ